MFLALIAVVAGSHLLARIRANQLADPYIREYPYSIHPHSWLQLTWQGHPHPHWGFIYRSGGETGGDIVELRVGLLGHPFYAKSTGIPLQL